MSFRRGAFGRPVAFHEHMAIALRMCGENQISTAAPANSTGIAESRPRAYDPVLLLIPAPQCQLRIGHPLHENEVV
jgi:hypothetical protein